SSTMRSDLGQKDVVERGAGRAAAFPDDAYANVGAKTADAVFDADIVAKVAPPSPDEATALRDGAVLVGFLAPLTDPDGIERLQRQRVIAFAMESIPRITPA